MSTTPMGENSNGTGNGGSNRFSDATAVHGGTAANQDGADQKNVDTPTRGNRGGQDEKHKLDSDDGDRKDLGGEGRTQEPDDDDFEGEDEYTSLLHYIDNAARERPKDEEEGDDEGAEYVRKWYSPWKKTKVQSVSSRVPPEWLETDMTRGLDDGEAENRTKKVGPNELTTEKENLFRKVTGYFRGPILYVMEIAVILAGGLQDWIDFGVIIAILALNAFVGFYQEKQAGDIVEQLKKGIALKAVVIRGGQEHEVEAGTLVPGDIILIEEGKTIPGDCILLAEYRDKDGSKGREIMERRKQSEGTKGAQGAPGQGSRKEAESGDNEKKRQDGGAEADGDEDEDEDKKRPQQEDDEEKVDKGPSICSVDQSAITGESLAVDKYHGDLVYYTTVCKRGKCYARMTTTAKKSFVGKTASLVTSSKEQGHFQKVMNVIGTTLLVMVVIFLFAVWVGGFFRGLKISEPKGNNLLSYTLVFLIIGVPVGLPCVTTTTLAVGAAYLAKRQAIVQRLTAVESLAGCNILCSDKTGTLTANKLSIHEPFTAEGVDPNWMMCVAVLASSHNVKLLDPIDKVTITTIKDYPKAREMLSEGWTTHSFRPFDPVSKRITAEVEKDGKKYTCAKGAPNAILKLCNVKGEVGQTYRAKSQEFASRGFRSLGVAVQEQGGEWQVLGLLPMFDPPRSDTAQTISEALELGVRIKMLTGDAVAIAKETCKMLNMGTNVYDSDRLINGQMAGSQLHDFVEAADGFAEVFPEHKHAIVDILQRRGHLTAMTGDGVNDAPALKKADCGIAVEGASDAARSAAAVVFLDEGLSTIITAIKVARQIFHRMKAYIVYRIALCIHLEVYLMLSMIILNETIRPDLVVFLALFADVATIAIAYDKAPYARTPVEWQLPKIWVMSTVLGLLLAAGTWIMRGTLFLSKDGKGGIIQNWGSTQEILFLEVSLTENWLIFLTRLGDGEWTWPSWQLIGAVLAVDIIATFIAIFGWISGDQPHNGHTDIVTIIRVWAFSLAVIVVLSIVYFILNQWKWLNNLGRSHRGKIDRRVEDFITELQHITVVHEQREEANDVYKLVRAAPPESDD